MELKEAIKDKLKYEKMEAQDIDLPMDEKKHRKLIAVLNQKLSEKP